jgi:hypothetical protein
MAGLKAKEGRGRARPLPPARADPPHRHFPAAVAIPLPSPARRKMSAAAPGEAGSRSARARGRTQPPSPSDPPWPARSLRAAPRPELRVPARWPSEPGAGGRGRGAGGWMGVTPSFRRCPVTARPGCTFGRHPELRCAPHGGRAPPASLQRPLPKIPSEPGPARARERTRARRSLPGALHSQAPGPQRPSALEDRGKPGTAHR